MTTNDHRPVLRGELVLVLAVIINSIGVLLMLHSGSGISAISSVPYAFNLVLPTLSLGTWTYIFQGLLVCVLMILRRKFVPAYLFSFVVGFCFGEMMDINELWVDHLPLSIPLRVAYFILSYLIFLPTRATPLPMVKAASTVPMPRPDIWPRKKKVMQAVMIRQVTS